MMQWCHAHFEERWFSLIAAAIEEDLSLESSLPMFRASSE
jgi:hypothetical protein